MAQWRTGSQLGAMPSAPPPDPPSPTLTNPDMILPDFDPMSLSPDITAGRSRGRLIDYSPSRALSSHPVSFMIPSPTAAELDPVVTSMAGSPPYERHGERNEAEYRRSSAGSRDVLPSSPTLPPMYHPGTEHMKPRSPASGTLRDSSYRDSDAHIVDESHDQAQAREAGSSSNFLAMPSRARQNRISGDSISTGGLHSDPDAANMDGDGDKSISSRTPAALSRRAEQILAHAKQSLDVSKSSSMKAC